MSVPNLEALKVDDAKLLTRLETCYWVEGDFPEFSLLLDEFATSAPVLKSTLMDIEPKLKARGLPPYPVPTDNAVAKMKNETFGDLDPLFVIVCNDILDFHDKRSIPAKLKAYEPVGVTTKTWQGWLKRPIYMEYYENLLRERFDKPLEMSAKLSLARNIEAGDLNSIKYYHEITRKHVPQNSNVISLQFMILALMEILAKHVPTNVIDAVAEELESLPLTRELTI